MISVGGGTSVGPKRRVDYDIDWRGERVLAQEC